MTNVYHVPTLGHFVFFAHANNNDGTATTHKIQANSFDGAVKRFIEQVLRPGQHGRVEDRQVVGMRPVVMHRSPARVIVRKAKR